ncbi:MAG: hypothetical protein FGM24_01285 [Candidatus Kapabacteria bacterium]|nr:hypothetical protein [Candidatus Kapabacteria bacterium]
MSFTETQHLSRQAIRVIRWILIIVSAFEVLLFSTIAFVEHDAWAMLPAAGTIAMLFVVMWMMRASTLLVVVDNDGIIVKARFFHRRGRNIPWTDVQRVQLRPLRAFSEFGGWGIRYGFRNATGYIYDGDHCLECVLQNQKRIVVSIVNIDDLRHVLTQQGRITAG